MRGRTIVLQPISVLLSSWQLNAAMTETPPSPSLTHLKIFLCPSHSRPQRARSSGRGVRAGGGSIRDGDPRPWTGSASPGGVLLPSIGRKKNRSVIPGRRTRSRLDRETPGFAGSTKPRDVDENDNRVSGHSGPDRIFSRNGRKGPERPETPFPTPAPHGAGARSRGRINTVPHPEEPAQQASRRVGHGARSILRGFLRSAKSASG